MIKYPLTCTTYGAKTAFVERAIRLMQIEHNIMGAWYNIDIPLISEALYQQLRAAVQIRWPYDGNKLSKVERGNYQAERFNSKMKALLNERGLLKEALYASTRFSPNLDDDIIDAS